MGLKLSYYFFCDLTLKTFLTFKAVSYSISIAINADVNGLSLTIIQTELFSSNAIGKPYFIIIV